MSANEQQIIQSMEKFIDPYLGCSWVKAGAIDTIELNDNRAKIFVSPGYPCLGNVEQWQQQLKQQLKSECNLDDVEVEIKKSIRPTPSTLQQGKDNIKNIIAVASGKGGVGKSTTAVNLALALKKEGAQVGLLDADIYGPSLPIMLDAKNCHPESKDQKTVEPVMRYGLQTMSIGYLVDADQAVVWRGPMASGALQQLINDTQWRDLDYLVVDLPPGTGDIQLTIAQKVPVSGAVIVTTPQDMSLSDAAKGIAMFEKVSIPVLGIVENMSMHICSQCGHQEAIFGQGGGANLAQKSTVPLLAQLPLDKSICDQTDAGCPSVYQDPEGAISQQYRELARKTAAKLVTINRDVQSINITMSDD